MKSNLFIFIALIASSAEVLAKPIEQLNIYSFRKLELIAPIISSFEKESGINVNLVHGKSKYLLKRLEVDGQKSQADLLLTSDLSQLANKKHLLQPFAEFSNLKNVNQNLIDDEKYWVSTSMRARTIFSAEHTKLPIPKYYSDFNKPQYHGQFCIRDFGLFRGSTALFHSRVYRKRSYLFGSFKSSSKIVLYGSRTRRF